MQKKSSGKVLVLVPDGVGVRNYLLSDMLSLMQEEGLSPLVCSPFKNKLKDIISAEIPQIVLKPVTEPFVVRFWREAICYARLSLNTRKTNNETILTNWNPDKSSFAKKLFFGFAEILGAGWESEQGIEKQDQRLFRWTKRSKAYKEYQRILLEHRVSTLFCTHQRAISALPFMLAAKDLGIRTATVIFSWDNLPKARLAFRSDTYLVWSEYMKKELAFYYPDIGESQIIVSGTPQFDFYKNKKLIEERAIFAKRYDLDPDKKWVLFSGDDKLTSPYDDQYLQDVADSLECEENIVLLFRQVPVETTDRYDKVLKTKSVKHIPPLWKKSEKWMGFMPTHEDITLLANLSYHCNAVINIGSSVALEFAVYDNIGLYINYDQPKAVGWSVDTIYSFQHFKTMNGLDAVGWINSKDDILKKVRMAIDTPEKIAKDRKVWLQVVTEFDSDRSSTRLIASSLRIHQ